MQISRRDALVGASAAVAVAGVPVAVEAKAAIAEPLLALEQRWLALGTALDNGHIADKGRWEASYQQWSAIQERIAQTPATTVHGLAVKLRLIAYENGEHGMDSSFGLTLIRSAVESAERLAGDARS